MYTGLPTPRALALIWPPTLTIPAEKAFTSGFCS